MMPQVERSSHGMVAVTDDGPAASARNLGNQAVSTEVPKDEADSGAGLFRVFATLRQMRRRGQPLSDIPVAETAQTVIAVHDAVE